MTDEHAKTTCKMGQGSSCCRYLTFGVAGFTCEKLTGLKDVIDGNAHGMTAQGDNCPGVENA